MSHNVPLVKKCLTQRMLTNSISINIFICSSRNCFCTSFNWLIIIRRQKYIFNVYNVYYCNHHNIPWISLQYKKRLLFKHKKIFFANRFIKLHFCAIKCIHQRYIELWTPLSVIFTKNYSIGSSLRRKLILRISNIFYRILLRYWIQYSMNEISYRFLIHNNAKQNSFWKMLYDLYFRLFYNIFSP